ncbi:TIGR03013 family XrtA/PEP-CTERM system glycosyltransferase [Chitinivorax sp. B]|uniref:TIGR03013 family XrtA/PEP-CTERM system glycosyltransferase n=1 Tax=Chitinivorax sp. B TaxID=2502235 RepID=UPI0010FA1EB3|nr:TIGR03013 family XrtA/PEP-CTERM system glycosyltransferase [Chitinivorax sp. B]
MLRIFNHYVPLTTLLLLFTELLAIGLSIYVVNYIPWQTFGIVGMHQLAQPILPKAAFVSLLMVGVMGACGLYQSAFVGGMREIAVRLIVAFGLPSIAMAVLIYWLESMRFGAREMFWSISVSLLSISLIRLVFFKWTNLGVFKPRVLVLGTGSRAVKVDEAARHRFGGNNLDIVGYMPPASATPHAVAASRILPEEENLLEAVEKYGINEIVIAIRDRRGGNLPIHELLECRMQGVRVLELSTFFERECGQVKLDSLNPSWMVFNDGFNQSTTRDVVKRIFDLSASFLLLLVASPFMLLTALAIKLEDQGPVLYSQERVGQNEQVFTIFKFRSMRTDSEKDGRPRWAQTNDDRITRVGKLIRLLRIDELPQIINVLRGDMSFVGPRPERPFFVSKLEAEIPYYAMRHCMKPGITGWAQVRYAYGATVEDSKEKLQYDLYYVKNHSLFLDILILIETVQVVLWGKGAR